MCRRTLAACSAGLSPRVRGNRKEVKASAPQIPVYPRVCGGTAELADYPMEARGLSPRVRGNLQWAGGPRDD